MVKLTKIYTRGGDSGKTSLVDGSRHFKDNARVSAYGTVDEANSIIGLARLHTKDSAKHDHMLSLIQNDLFDLGADLATPPSEGDDYAPQEMVLRIVPTQTVRLETEIDAMNEHLAPLNSFILPGGSPASAFLHQARTVVRRAERDAIHAQRVLSDDTENAAPAINPEAIKYLNRLSDHLFVLGRVLNDNGATDVLWVPGQNR